MSERAKRPDTADPSDARALRSLLGLFPTGVVVITALRETTPYGLAANSFTSVSLDPPLVSFCAGHSSETWPQLRAVGAFTVNVLSASAEATSRSFARKGTDRFAGVRWQPSPGGHPVLADALAWLDCTLEVVHEAGDHDLVIGRVTHMSGTDDQHPLLFYRGRYGALSDSVFLPENAT